MMDKHQEQSSMVGKTVLDYHKNTAKCGKVNDRLRRGRKRAEKEELKLDIKSGALTRLSGRT